MRCPKNVAHAGASAFLTVQEGCDKFCTFCVVPYTRGANIRAPSARSRPKRGAWCAAACARSRCWAERQCLSRRRPRRRAVESWRELLRRLAEIDGVARLRYTTSHPRDMDDELVAAHGEMDALMPYLHLPVQSGSDRVLAAMNRQHTRR